MYRWMSGRENKRVAVTYDEWVKTAKADKREDEVGKDVSRIVERAMSVPKSVRVNKKHKQLEVSSEELLELAIAYFNKKISIKQVVVTLGYDYGIKSSRSSCHSRLISAVRSALLRGEYKLVRTEEKGEDNEPKV